MMTGDLANVPPPSAQRRRKDNTMNRNMIIAWNDENQNEKSITIDTSYDLMNHRIHADISLRGEDVVRYHSTISLDSDDWMENEKTYAEMLLALVLHEIQELGSLPIADEIDPAIVRVGDALSKMMPYWLNQKKPWDIDEDELELGPR